MGYGSTAWNWPRWTREASRPARNCCISSGTRRFSPIASSDPECAGTWLDAGELATIRSEFATEEERHKATESYFDEVFGTQLTALHAADVANDQRVQNIAGMFRFICPSFYVPGKQKWGAF